VNTNELTSKFAVKKTGLSNDYEILGACFSLFAKRPGSFITSLSDDWHSVTMHAA
jgi:hypothetical protein